MTDNELLLALRNELQPIKDEIRATQNQLNDFRIYVENIIEPKIQLLAENYVPAAQRYEKTTPEIHDLKQDVELLKKVVSEHSEELNPIA